MSLALESAMAWPPGVHGMLYSTLYCLGDSWNAFTRYGFFQLESEDPLIAAAPGSW